MLFFLSVILLVGPASGSDRETDTLPLAYDLRDIDGRSYIGEPRDQDNCGSCYAFGALATVESAWNLANDLYDDRAIDLSEAFIVWSLSPLYDNLFFCYGGNLTDSMNSIVDYGAPLEADFPYVFTYTSEPDGSTTADFGDKEHWDAERYSMAEWYNIPPNDIETTKRVINSNGSIFTALLVEDDFVAYSSGIFQNDYTATDHSIPAESSANHAISLVGWNDEPEDAGMGYWILRNSWSDDWGEDGYMRIRYLSAGVNFSSAYSTLTIPDGESTIIENSGLIEAVKWSSGGNLNAHGVDLWGGAGSSVNNYGTIRAEAAMENEMVTARGVYLWGGPEGRVVNSGTIAGSAESRNNQAIAYAISMQGGTIVNSGRLLAEAESHADQAMAIGIWAANGAGSLDIQNSDYISARAVGSDVNAAYGIWADSREKITIINSGNIDVSGDDYAIAILATGGPVHLENRGTIQSIADLNEGSGYGVQTTEAGTIINSGVIGGTDYSVYAQKNTLLVLETGSDLSGPVKLSGSEDQLLLRGEGTEDVIFDGVESLSMEGVRWYLSGNSDFENILISRGSLGIDGAISGDTTVLDGAVLKGTGILTGNVMSSGTTSPGNSIGVLNIVGDFSQDANGVMWIETGRNIADRLIINGAANIGGSLVIRPVEFTDSGSYTFLEAVSGVNGGFDNVHSVAVLDVDISQSTFGHLTMDVTRKSYASLATNHNFGLAQDLDVTRSRMSGDTEKLFNRVDLAPDANELNTLLTQLTPGVHGLTSTMILHEAQDLNQRLGRRIAGTGARILSVSRSGKELSLWGEFFGRNIHLKSKGAYSSMKNRSNGLVLGMEGRFPPGLTVGVSTAVTKSDYISNESADRGVGEAVYGQMYAALNDFKFADGLTIGASLGAGTIEIETDREVPFAGRKAHSRHHGRIYTALLQGNYKWQIGTWMINPYGGLRWARLHEKGFQESGANGADLFIYPRDSDTKESYLGAGIERSFIWKKAMLKPSLEIEWVHELNSDGDNIRSSLPGSGVFSTPGRGFERQSMRLGAGLYVKFTDTVSISMGYNRTLDGTVDQKFSLLVSFNL